MPKKKKAETQNQGSGTPINEEVEELTGKELEEAAEAESLVTDKILNEKKKKLLEKAKKLAEKIASTSTEEMKEKVKEKKKGVTLLPLDEYVKAGIYIGTKVVTPEMKKYVYRRRADGLAIFNTDIIDEKIKDGIEFLSKYNPNEVIVVCKRQSGWNAVKMFSEITGIRVFTKKYPAGILTNIRLPNFFETEMAIICDSWMDKNAFNDVKNVRKKVMMICDTNNFPRGADQTVIGNNKSGKSFGLIFYLLARGYCEKKGINKEIPELEEWEKEEGL
jgi:small subunit ribosomal protein S2